MRLLAVRLLAVRLLAVRLLAVRLSAMRLLAVRLSPVRLSAVRLSAVRLSAGRLSAVRLLAVRLLAVRLLAVRLLAARLLAVRLLAARLLAVRLLAARLLTVRLLAVRLLAVRLLAVRLLAVRLLAVRLSAARLSAMADRWLIPEAAFPSLRELVALFEIKLVREALWLVQVVRTSTVDPSDSHNENRKKICLCFGGRANRTIVSGSSLETLVERFLVSFYTIHDPRLPSGICDCCRKKDYGVFLQNLLTSRQCDLHDVVLRLSIDDGKSFLKVSGNLIFKEDSRESKDALSSGVKRTHFLAIASVAESYENVIRFPNEACNGTGNVVGTCYTDQECQTRNGMAMGACANGYGVCCACKYFNIPVRTWPMYYIHPNVLVTISCGQTSLENCTIFNDNTAPDMGVCTGTICPISPNICQLRLDFMAFQISGPVTDSIQVTDILNGFSISPITGSPPVPRGIPNSAVGQCLTDIFQVTSGSANNPPGICGMNSDEHMFVDADESCNALSFQFGGGNFNREFSIKITQYTCDSPNLAPSGCTQYFVTENGRGQVQTFNFAGGLHLSDQNQVMCVRQNRDSCRICWTAMNNDDFDVS
eukprot:maker-scaffold1608_size33912-snap-gene-0.9 protein:Tk04815 transcript:maker-scaffold1608_size33912-snap-gene-0.9-mRNA-1 annotation:"hypothetical protein KGM_18655"